MLFQGNSTTHGRGDFLLTLAVQVHTACVWGRCSQHDRMGEGVFLRKLCPAFLGNIQKNASLEKALG